jgi:hypothetical protein
MKESARPTGDEEGTDGAGVDACSAEDEDFRAEVPKCEKVGEQGHVIYTA